MVAATAAIVRHTPNQTFVALPLHADPPTRMSRTYTADRSATIVAHPPLTHPSPQPDPSHAPPTSPAARAKAVLVTAGPTHEPIDAVRYISNRSSGRLGIAVAEAAARRGHRVELLLGPTHLLPEDSRVVTHRFQTTAELETLLAARSGVFDWLVMAAAVADYRPAASPANQKLPRSASNLTLHLTPTPDLLAAVSQRRRPGQLLVGFALEPAERLETSARAKLQRKSIDAIVANPLETMDSPGISAMIFTRWGESMTSEGTLPKERFADRLISLMETWDLEHISTT